MSVCVKQNGQLVKTAGLYRSEVPIGIADIYSEEEKEIGVYVDGKTLYQKTFYLTNVEIAANGRTIIISTSDLSVLSIEKVVGGVNGCADFNNGVNIINIPYAVGYSNGSICAYYDNTYGICIHRLGGTFTLDNLYLTIKYTKTTDTPTTLPPSNASSLYMMGDVEISEPQNGQAIIFDETDNKWKNGAGGGGGTANIWAGTQAELEEEFDDIPDDTQIVVYDDEQEVVEGGTIYSEDEQTIGLWKDSKPLYQKTITITRASIAGNTTIDITSELSSLNIEVLVATESFITCTSNGHNYKYNDESLARLSIADDTSYGLSLGISSGTITNLTINFTIKYTKSTDVPIDAVVGKSTMYIASSDCYSTEEKEIGCWLDGKPLYKRTVVFNNPASNRVDNLSHGITNIDTIVRYEWAAYDSAGTVISGFEGTASNWWSSMFNISKSSVSYRIGSSWLMTKLIVTLCYTKTTDTAGSGSYTPASGKAVHYSTDEQVIGTWIDGSTLYRRVVPFTSARTNVQTNTWTELPEVDASNILQVTNSVLIYYSAETPNYRVNIPCMCSTNRDAFNQHLAFAHLRPTAVSFSVGNMIIIEYTKITD